MYVAGGGLSVSGGICVRELGVKRICCLVGFLRIATVRSCRHIGEIIHASYSRTAVGAILKSPVQPAL